ncbi:MAG: Uma2 family endonuclease [Lyngbya sp.]|nr:Uma2 family endonuclease [Lyngbya sp.]
MSLTKPFNSASYNNFNLTDNSLTPEQFELYQSHLLESTFIPANYPSDQVFAGCSINLFFDPRRPQEFKCPDWFGVVGVDKFYQGQQIRTSFVTWQESFNPFVVIEFLSDETTNEDLGQTPIGVDAIPTKWDVYEQFLRIPYYILFEPKTDKLEAFHLVGSRYEQLEPTQQGIWIPHLELGLGLWKGVYQGIEHQWLRWYDVGGNWIEFPKNQQSIPQPESQRIQHRKKVDKQQKIGQKLSERLKKIGIKVDLT